MFGSMVVVVVVKAVFPRQSTSEISLYSIFQILIPSSK